MIFKEYNLNWKNFVVLSKKLQRPNENKIIFANINKIKKLNIYPKIFLPEIIKKLKD